MKHYYFDKFMEYCYPYETDKRVLNYGVLEEYMDKQFTRDEIDEIICKLITKHPYVSGSMDLKLSISRIEEGKYRQYYHILTFKNDNYDSQEKGCTILFEK